MAYLLEPVGLGETDNAVYLALVGTPKATLIDLAGQVRMPLGAVRLALDTLIGAGLATALVTNPVRYLPAPPDVAVEALVARRHLDLQGLRAAAHDLTLRLVQAPSTGTADLVELVDGDEAIQHQSAQMQLGARDEVLIIDAPPYLRGTPVQNKEELQGLQRGIGYRCIYDRPALEIAGHYDQLQECVEAGEEARTLTSVSMKMQIVDRRVAMIPVTFAAPETRTRLLVLASPILDALVQCFESLWRQAVPVNVVPETIEAGQPTERDLRLLALLATGMKDRAIARSLGITERTLSRHLHDLLNALEADTRFQACLQAVHRGWLRVPTAESMPETVA